MFYSVVFYLLLWEDIKNTSQTKRKKKLRKSGIMNTILEIKKELIDKPNKDIKKKRVVLNTKHRLNGKVRPRECPNCCKILVYKNERQRHLAIHYNRLCNRCSSINRENKLNKDIRIDFDVINNTSMYYRFCPKCNNKVYYKSPSHRNQLKKKNSICRKCFKLDKFIYPNFNKSACVFFDDLNKQNNWNLQHDFKWRRILY